MTGGRELQAMTLKAGDRRKGLTLRELDELVAQATAAGVDWDSPLYVRDTFLGSGSEFLASPGLRFRQLTVILPQK